MSMSDISPELVPASLGPGTTSAEDLTDLIGLDAPEFVGVAEALELPSWRAKQLWSWVYHHRSTDFSQMSNIGKELQNRLAENYVIGRPDVASRQISSDGTVKWLVKFADGNLAETVLIPEDDRLTLCISSQVGCTLNCRFCHTGTQTLVRNLSAAEIVGQLMIARDFVAAGAPGSEHAYFDPLPDGAKADPHRVSNIVMMGMGEPLYNFDNVKKALSIVTDGDGIAISKRRVTVSTAGVVPMMERCGNEIGVKLAVSLHAVTDELRDVIVPINKKYPIAELLGACRTYPDARNSRRITFEYVLLKGVNDSPSDARELVRLIKGIPSKVNLIPFNPWPGAPYERSSDEAIEIFAQIVRDAGYPSPVRRPRGDDILAACGQLKSVSERRRKSAP
jgi:23S rRNA (adenine2503-C2)-methyltransferase